MAKRIELASPRRITSDGASFRRPAWSPDGRKLVVEALEQGGALYLVDGKGRVETRLGLGTEAAWSPDGARLAFTRVGVDGRREVWLCDVAQPEMARRIAGGDGGSWEHPAWSPDGARIACASDWGNPAGVRHLWVLDAAAGDRSRLTADPSRSDGHPSWSTDGRALAFDASDRADDAREIDVHVLELQSGQVERLTDGTVATRRPVFLDRRWLIAERRTVSGPALVVVDREKRRTLPVGERAGGEREPAVHRRKKGRVEVAYVSRGGEGVSSGTDSVWVADLDGLRVTSEAEAADEAIRAAMAEVERAGLPTLGVDAPLPDRDGE
jgi:Tol biopolymer transport system component